VKSKFIPPKPQPYNYDMYEGIDYVMDISKPVGERITNLAFKEKAIEPEDTLELVTNQYRAVGGGDFSMFEGKEFIREINVSMSDLITAYIKEQGTIQALCNNNFKIING
ncbi:MAG: 5'-nucleotidase C-terminal domain-containing protein, partial [Tetragenococcus koreensis]|nr:5'-nucleotidase C-terminal domain-containing protein [Tetragenococcus koreensis]